MRALWIVERFPPSPPLWIDPPDGAVYYGTETGVGFTLLDVGDMDEARSRIDPVIQGMLVSTSERCTIHHYTFPHFLPLRPTIYFRATPLSRKQKGFQKVRRTGYRPEIGAFIMNGPGN